MSKIVCPGCKRSLDDVIESMIRQRGRFKGQREAAREQRDRFREALQRIADIPDNRLGIVGETGVADLRRLAQEALSDDA